MNHSTLTVCQWNTLRELGHSTLKNPSGRFRRPRRRQRRTMRALERSGHIVDATTLPNYPRWRFTAKGLDAIGRL